MMLLLFAVLSILHIILIIKGASSLTLFTKPLLIPTLLIAYATATGLKNSFSRLFSTALIFCWAGDVLLMKNEYFIYGLVSFLTGHIFYILAIATISGRHFIAQKPYLLVPVILYLAIFLWFLLPYLQALKIPVVLYALVINCFLVVCLNLFGKLPRRTAGYFFAGATLFVISDSLLAVNTFAVPFPLSGAWVMLTYCAAQYLLVKGAITYHLSVSRNSIE